MEVLTQKGAIVRIKKANTILKCLVNILFGIKYTYHDTNQTDKAREQKIRWETTVNSELKRKYDYWIREYWEGGGVFKHYKY